MSIKYRCSLRDLNSVFFYIGTNFRSQSRLSNKIDLFPKEVLKEELEVKIAVKRWIFPELDKNVDVTGADGIVPSG